MSKNKSLTDCLEKQKLIPQALMSLKDFRKRPLSCVYL